MGISGVDAATAGMEIMRAFDDLLNQSALARVNAIELGMKPLHRLAEKFRVFSKKKARCNRELWLKEILALARCADVWLEEAGVEPLALEIQTRERLPPRYQIRDGRPSGLRVGRAWEGTELVTMSQ